MDRNLKGLLIEGFRWVDPGPHSAHLVSDISGWWRDPIILPKLGPALADLFPGDPATVIVSPETTGFVLGPLVACAMGAGFVGAYKHQVDRQSADRMVWGCSGPDYRGRRLSLGVRAARLTAGDRALLVDDWAVTGAQIGALHDALRHAGVTVIGAAVVVNECPAATAAEFGVRGLLRASDLPGMPTFPGAPNKPDESAQ